jgi:hypothetical protein
MPCNPQEYPAKSDTSISARDEHVAESRALYQKLTDGAINGLTASSMNVAYKFQENMCFW